ncbi:MAG: hypothetical protein D6713_06765 [Deltaproteobacteria bacterium]|nr:MAG: hypothetical protein D6713_06765 [Deltaproteobacteria bacterium]
MGGYLLLGKTVLFSFLAGILSLDRVAVFQGMLHRPLVISFLGGLIFGSLHETVMVGLLLEVLWSARLPVGAQVPPDDTLAALFGVCAVAFASSQRSVGFGDLGVIVSLSVLVGELGREADIFVRKVNARLSRYGKTALDLGDFRTFESSIKASVIVWLLVGTVSSLLAGLLGASFGNSLGLYLDGSLLRPFRMMCFVIPAVGTVSLYQHCRVGRRGALFHTALASGAFVFALFEMGVL